MWNFRGWDVTEADLRFRILLQVNFSGAGLKRADLYGADLSGANLSDADLRSASLEKANIADAWLTGANLSGATLRYANLSGTDFSQADLRQVTLTGAHLRTARLTDGDHTGVDLEHVALKLGPKRVTYQQRINAIVGVQRCVGTTMGANSRDLDSVEMSCPGLDERSKRMAQNGSDSNESLQHESQPGASLRQALGPGTKAPSFTLHTTPDQTVSLADFRGQPVVLMFYPADWSPVCSDEMALFNEVLPEFRRLRAELMGISVDGVWCHLAFARERRLQFPLLADFEPKGDVARRYGVYRRQDGTTERAQFVIDDDGVIRWSYVSPIGVNPGADGALTALDNLPKPQSATSAQARQASDR